MSFLEAVGRTKVDPLDDPTLLLIVGISPPGVHKGSNFRNTFVFPIDISAGENFVWPDVTGNASLGRYQLDRSAVFLQTVAIRSLVVALRGIG